MALMTVADPCAYRTVLELDGVTDPDPPLAAEKLISKVHCGQVNRQVTSSEDVPK